MLRVCVMHALLRVSHSGFSRAPDETARRDLSFRGPSVHRCKAQPAKAMTPTRRDHRPSRPEAPPVFRAGFVVSSKRKPETPKSRYLPVGARTARPHKKTHAEPQRAQSQIVGLSAGIVHTRSSRSPRSQTVGARTARPHHGETQSLGRTRRPQSPFRDCAGRSPRQGTDSRFLLRFRSNRTAKQPCWPLGSGGLWFFPFATPLHSRHSRFRLSPAAPQRQWSMANGYWLFAQWRNPYFLSPPFLPISLPCRVRRLVNSSSRRSEIPKSRYLPIGARTVRPH